jgi:hypothetical protein
MSHPYARFIVIRKKVKMAYSREAHELLDQTLEVLKTKTNYAYPRMVGYLMVNVDLPTAQRIAKLVEEMEVQND